jgi:AraC-like DNA-binding protein
MTAKRSRPTPDATWLRLLLNPANSLQWVLCNHTNVAPDWAFTDRVLDEHLMYLIVGGRLRVQRPVRRVLSPGGFLWLAPGVAHTFGLCEQHDLTLYHARFSLRQGRRDVAAPQDVTVLDDAASLHTWWPTMYDEFTGQGPHAGASLRSLLALVCADVFRLRSKGDGVNAKTLSAAQRRALVRYANEHVAERFLPADLAAAVGLSADYFARVFRRSFGMSSRRWILQHRIRRAAMVLLESNRTVSQTAYAFGYDDVYLFSRQFRQVMGMAPSAYGGRR